MSAVYYDSLSIYVTSATDRNARIARIKAAIDALEAQRLAIALNDNQSAVSEYSLDDGQSKIKTVYRNLDEINKSLKVLETELQRMYSQGNGRMVRLRDGKNFNWR